MRRPRLVAALVPCLVGFLLAPVAQAGEALVIGQVGFIREGTDLAVFALESVLQANGHIVTQRNPHVGDALDDMETFDCVWDIRTDFTWSAAEDALFENYLVSGGNLYFAGEHAAFNFRNDPLVNKLTALGGGPIELSLVVPPGAMGMDDVEPTNPANSFATDCLDVSEVDYDGVGNGTFLQSGTGEWLTGAPDAAGATSWGPGSLAGAPDATVVAILDINWMYDGENGTLFFRVDDPTVPTENLALMQNLIDGLCGAPPCVSSCEPRNHGYWHRYCLGQDAIDPGRNGHGNGPGPQKRHADLPDNLLSTADGAMSGYGLGACEALDAGPFSDPRLAALRELATIELNLAAGFLKRSCPVELRPVIDEDDLTVGDAISEMESRLADGSVSALHEARWIGEHIVNGEALIDED